RCRYTSDWLRRDDSPADSTAEATCSAGASGLVVGGASHVIATAGSGTCGPNSVAVRSICHGGSLASNRGSGALGFGTAPKYLSIQPSSCFSSKSPATISVALSGR